MKTHLLIFLIAIGICLSGCIRLVHEISPEFNSEGTVNINIRTDSDDPNVNVTIDDVELDWEELKLLIDKKMKEQKSGKKSKSKKPKEKTLKKPAS